MIKIRDFFYFFITKILTFCLLFNIITILMSLNCGFSLSLQRGELRVKKVYFLTLFLFLINQLKIFLISVLKTSFYPQLLLVIRQYNYLFKNNYYLIDNKILYSFILLSLMLQKINFILFL